MMLLANEKALPDFKQERPKLGLELVSELPEGVDTEKQEVYHYHLQDDTGNDKAMVVFILSGESSVMHIRSDQGVHCQNRTLIIHFYVVVIPHSVRFAPE